MKEQTNEKKNCQNEESKEYSWKEITMSKVLKEIENGKQLQRITQQAI